MNRENIDQYYQSIQGKYRRLSRDFEKDLPQFSSHLEAKDFFEDLFGDDFVLKSVEKIDNESVYFYEIIHNRNMWEKFMKDLSAHGYASGIEGLMSSQDVQIWESGNVHIIF